MNDTPFLAGRSRVCKDTQIKPVITLIKDKTTKSDELDIIVECFKASFNGTELPASAFSAVDLRVDGTGSTFFFKTITVTVKLNDTPFLAGRSRDGKHFPMKDFQPGVTAPPFHVWCRSCTCPYFEDEFTENETRAARGEDGKTYQVPADMKYPEWKKAFVDGEDKDRLIYDMIFSVKKDSNISNEQKQKDMKTFAEAYEELPEKVKKLFGKIRIEFGHDGSACDVINQKIMFGIGISKEEVFHEYGHLIE